MASVNRFTQIEPTKYSPRTLQELMMVPMYKRGQHDSLDEKIATTEAAISQLDPLDVHYDRAMSEQKKIMDQLNAQAEQLQQKGFSRTSTSDFQRLNKQYQQAISPTGDLGKIQIAKKAAETEKANILANAIQMGHDPVKTQRRIDEEYAKYGENFTKTGKIENFKAPLPPKYEDLMEDLKEIKVMAGTTIETKKGREGYSITEDPLTRKLVATTTSGQIITEDNKTQLGAGLKMLNDKWLKEGGAGYASAKWNEISVEELTNTINNASILMNQKKTEDTRSKSYQFMDNPAAQYNDDGPILDFVTDQIQGYNLNKLSPDSVLLGLDRVITSGNMVNGYIQPGTTANSFKTYNEKVESYKKNPSNIITYNKEKDLYTVSTYNAKLDKVITSDIPKDLYHYKQQITDLRKNNPILSELNDEEIIQKLQTYKQSLTATFVDSIDLIGSNYEWLNDRFFGNEKGTGESGAGTLSREGATVNGKELTADMVYKTLGYKNDTDFKTKGKPALQGYVPTSGEFRVSVLDSKGVARDIFVEGTEQLQNISSTSQEISKYMLEAKSFADLGPHNTNPEYHGYMINDFSGDPYIIFSKNKNAKNPEELINIKSINQTVKANNKGDEIYRFSEITAKDKMNILKSSHFQRLSGVNSKKK